MSQSFRRKPGAGFVLLATVAIGVLGFLAWGMSRPALDRAWWIQVELMVAQRDALSHGEFRSFQEVLAAHPKMASAMLDGPKSGFISANARGVVGNGYAYLVRTDARDSAVVEVEAFGATEKIAVCARTLDEKHCGPATHHTPFSWPTPDSGAFPQLIEVRIDTREASKRRPVNALVRIGKGT